MRSRLLPLTLFLAVAVVLVITVDDFVHQVIVNPLLYVFWFVTLVMNSLPQQAFWGVFIVVALVIAVKSMAREQDTRRRGSNPTTSNRGPVATWLSRLDRAENQDFSRWRLAQSLRKLTWDTLVPDEPLDHLQLEDQRKKAELDLPPDIAAYFDAPMPSSQGLPRFWRRHTSGSPSSALRLDAETVVKYLETELDVLIGEQ